jgi:hypothetical protein
MEFKVKVFFRDYVKVDEEFKSVEISRPFFCNTYDDLNNLIATLVDFSAAGSVLKFEIQKSIEEEE